MVSNPELQIFADDGLGGGAQQAMGGVNATHMCSLDGQVLVSDDKAEKTDQPTNRRRPRPPSHQSCVPAASTMQRPRTWVCVREGLLGLETGLPPDLCRRRKRDDAMVHENPGTRWLSSASHSLVLRRNDLGAVGNGDQSRGACQPTQAPGDPSPHSQSLVSGSSKT